MIRFHVIELLFFFKKKIKLTRLDCIIRTLDVIFRSKGGIALEVYAIVKENAKKKAYRN